MKHRKYITFVIRISFSKRNAMKKYNVTFMGYRRDVNAGTLPSSSGVYMVYRCKYNEESKTVDLKELFYIGQAFDLNHEINYHARHEEFLAQAEEGEQICYAYARVDKADLDIVENALIFAQKPRLNQKLKNSYNHEAAELQIEGKCALLHYTDYSIGE